MKRFAFIAKWVRCLDWPAASASLAHDSKAEASVGLQSSPADNRLMKTIGSHATRIDSYRAIA